MNYYYIDFENVKTAGLKGIENLPSVDTVKIVSCDCAKLREIHLYGAVESSALGKDLLVLFKRLKARECRKHGKAALFVRSQSGKRDFL